MKGDNSMLNILKTQINLSRTENGALTNRTSGSDCVDLFFTSGALRTADEDTIEKKVIRAYAEDPEKTLKIIFFARDVRGGQGERRFFRIALKALAQLAPEAVNRNAEFISEYGRFDDLLCLLRTPCEDKAIDIIRKQLFSDMDNMHRGRPASLLAKWLPSVNASCHQTVCDGRRIASRLGYSERVYRKILSSLRRYTDITENRLRERDYTFDYSKLPSYALFRYRAAFMRNDAERYIGFLKDVQNGKATVNSSVLFPYDIVRKCLGESLPDEEKTYLDQAWKALSQHGGSPENDNALAVIDGSGSMYCGGNGVRPVDAAFSLGLYLAERNKGAFGGHFITFSRHPQLIEVKGEDIFSKVQYCRSFDEIANTDLEAVFRLLLDTAVNNGLSQNDLPARLYIISDMEFDGCVMGGNSMTMFQTMRELYEKHGYSLPQVVFWNVNSRQSNIPVTRSETGAALVSGFSPALFDMIRSEDISAEKIMNDIIYSKRYEPIR